MSKELRYAFEELKKQFDLTEEAIGSDGSQRWIDVPEATETTHEGAGHVVDSHIQTA